MNPIPKTKIIRLKGQKFSLASHFATVPLSFILTGTPASVSVLSAFEKKKKAAFEPVPQLYCKQDKRNNTVENGQFSI